jgi:hypothetical protein
MHSAHAKSKETLMRIELKSGAVRLARGQTLRIVDGAGSTVCARDGTLWITEENRVRDVVLKAPQCYRLRHPGVAVVEALGEASVALN